MPDDWLRYKSGQKGMDLGVSGADWISLGGELHLVGVRCCYIARHSVCNSQFLIDLASVSIAASLVCTFRLIVTSVSIWWDC